MGCHPERSEATHPHREYAWMRFLVPRNDIAQKRNARTSRAIRKTRSTYAVAVAVGVVPEPGAGFIGIALDELLVGFGGRGGLPSTISLI